jgi:hypothetical protein
MSSLPTSNLEEFKNQLFNENQATKIKEEQNQQSNVIKVRKNLVLSFCSDQTGCGILRNYIPFDYLNSIFGKSGRLVASITPFFIMQPDILVQTRTLFFQRQMAPRQVPLVKQYKQMQEKYKYKMVWELDDFIWKGDDKIEGLPNYNFGSEQVTQEVCDAALEIMNMCDRVTVSTEYLKTYMKDVLKVIPEIVVLPNSIPKYFFNRPDKKPIDKKIEKPKVVVTSSPTHWHEGKKLLGDWGSGEWLEFIKKSIRDDKIDFFCFGVPQAPFFFKEFEGRNNFHIIPWLSTYQYYSALCGVEGDFIVMPLVKNKFNMGKSDLKQIEGSAVGAISIGTVFSDGSISPYDNSFVKVSENVSLKEIEELFDFYTEPENYNKVIKDQYEWIKREGRYTESPQNINRWTAIL